MGAPEAAEKAVRGSLARNGAIISLSRWRRREFSMLQPTRKMQEAMGSRCVRIVVELSFSSFELDLLNLMLGFLARLRRLNAGRKRLAFGGHCHWLPRAKAVHVDAC